MTETMLSIPPKPETPAPILKRGWQWVDSHWAAYWLMTFQGINNRSQTLKIEPIYIQTSMNTLRWFETYPKTKGIFEKILKTENYSEPSKRLGEWYLEAGLLIPDKGFVQFMEEIVLQTSINQLKRHEVLEFYFDKPIRFSRSSHEPFSNGRHRTYAAWKCGLPKVFMWVSI